MSDEFLCAGIECGNTLYLAVWCAGGSGGTFNIPLHPASGKECGVRCVYPDALAIPVKWKPQESLLTVTMKGKTARILEIKIL
jgi:hypothetical protein